LEQEKDWAAVLSKSSKKATAKAKPQKHVCFDKNLVHHSSLDKTHPKHSPVLQNICFGSFSCPINSSPKSILFGNTSILNGGHDRHQVRSHSEEHVHATMQW
jgi:hypothetical protein